MIEPKCTPEMAEICINSNKCHLCFDDRLFRKPKWMEVKEREAQRRKERRPKKKKEGMSFEKKVLSKINRVSAPANKNDYARRRPNSGAVWHLPGDIVTKKELIECKERGTRNSRGKEQITIQRAQLSKIQEEGLLTNKTPYLIFAFKDDPEFYVIKRFDDELEMLEILNEIKEGQDNGL